MSDDELLDLIPYSARRRRPVLNTKLPQDRTFDEDLEAIVEEHMRAERRNGSVNLGFARMKGHRT